MLVMVTVAAGAYPMYQYYQYEEDSAMACDDEDILPAAAQHTTSGMRPQAAATGRKRAKNTSSSNATGVTMRKG
jgi:hypothetical protein